MPIRISSTRSLSEHQPFAMLRPLPEHLHQEQCDRDTAGNRKLHYDQYCMLVLLYVLNPTVSSLRALTQASELAKVQRRRGSSKTSLGSISEASDVFDSDSLSATRSFAWEKTQNRLIELLLTPFTQDF